uniref:AAA+ ATPase domain-containing protein n=2 Tax=Brassica campestris TaxID=3711 RepID=M4CVF1_BRACM
MVYQHDGGDVSYSDLGGLTHQLKDVRDWIERPLIDPDIFERVGVKPPKVVSSSLVSKYVGESPLMVREMFKYAREHQPCIIFLDEIDAIGRRRSSYGEGDTSECDRVLIELLSQLDGFNELDKVKVIMATNRPDVLDPALLRPGRIDKKIEFSLPNEDSRMRILKIHASGITKQGAIDYEKVVKLSEGFNGADMRNICTEAGMLALRAGHDYVVPSDFIKASMEDVDEEIERRINDEKVKRGIAIMRCKSKLLIRNINQERTKTVKENLEALKIALEETEDELKYFTTTHAELVGEVVQPLGKERFLVKVNEGVRYIVNRSSLVAQSKLVSGTRVSLQRRTFTIMRILPPEVNPLVQKMVYQHDGGDVSYSDLGGLTHQLKDVRDWIERPLIDPDIFERVGVKPPKGVLLYGPPGTGKTLLAKAIASYINSTFLMVVSSSLVSKYVGESSLLVREMFKYAREHQPCIIFMDEIDAVGRRRSRYGEGETSECNRVLVELLSQLDGFNELDKVKVIMATNRPDVLDPALLRPGRIDKKIEFSLPNEDSRMRILKIHASGITKQGAIDYEKVVKLSEGFSGADVCNICTEAGMLALRAGHDYVVPNDFIKAVTKLGEAKKLESSAHYSAGF